MSYLPDPGSMSWGALVLLGAFHGINPGMGWLFAVALGMQENRASAVWRALVPLAAGHAASVAVSILVVAIAGSIIPPATLRWPVAALLCGLGLRRLVRHGHPRYGGMRMGLGRLAVWSFLVATAHGAGVMVVPVWLHGQAPAIGHAHHVRAASDLWTAVLATAVHAGSYLGVTALIAWIVYTWAGVGILRTAWINLDIVWAAALIASGVLMVL